MVGNFKKISIFTALAIGIFMSPLGVLAADYGTEATLEATGGLLPKTVAGASTVPEVVGAIVKIILSLVGIVFFGLIFYAGFGWMTAQGNSEKVDKSKTTIVEAALGLIIVLAAYAITNFVFSNLVPGGSSGGSNPDKPCLDRSGTCGTPASCALPKQVITGLCSGGANNVCCAP